MVELTPEEKSAHDKMQKATEELGTELVKLINATKQINVAGTAVACQLLTINVDVLLGVLFEMDSTLRMKFWERVAAAMDATASDTRKAMILSAEPPRKQ